MANILVRNVPDDVHAALQHKAARSHQSLQQYLAYELRQLAARCSVGEVLDEIEIHEGGQVGFDQAVKDLEDDRNRE